MIILGTNSIKDTGFDVANSLRFNEGSSDSLQDAQSTPTNGKKFTISFWAKFMEQPSGNAQEIMGGGTDGSNETFLRYTSNETIQFRHDHASDTNWQLQTNRKFRDYSSWYHIVAAVDTTQGTSSNRVKLYVNGVQETSLATANYPAVNEETFLNKASATVKIGQQAYQNSAFFSGYMCEYVFCDGQQLDATSFGEFDEDSGIWKPINVSGLTFGNNGFYLEFKESGTGTNSSGMGADTSGNTNHFAVNNLTAVDQSTDTCTNNFATLNPLDFSPNPASFTDGNLNYNKTSTGSGHNASSTGTLGVIKGKWYFEFKLKDTNDFACGIIRANHDNPNSNGLYTADSGVYAITNGSKIVAGSEGSQSVSYSANAIFGFAYDLDNGKFYVHINGTYLNSGNPTSGSTGTGSLGNINLTNFYVPLVSNINHGVTNDIEFNFGSPIHSISSSQADDDGNGNFEYDVPTGYFALCTKNLAEYG